MVISWPRTGAPHAVSRLRKEDVIGHSKDGYESYDLMEVIMIRRGDAEIDEEIFDFLNGIFKSETERLNRYTGDDPGIAEEVKKMGGFGAALVEKTATRARAEGRQEGRVEGEQQVEQNAIVRSIRNLMTTMKWTAEQAMDALMISADQRPTYTELMNQTN